MPELKQIEIIGWSDCSVPVGQLENALWNWSLGLDGILFKELISQERGLEFIKKILPYFPEHCGRYTSLKGSYPGGKRILQMPLEATSNPEEVNKILKEYFQKAFDGEEFNDEAIRVSRKGEVEYFSPKRRGRREGKGPRGLSGALEELHRRDQNKILRKRYL